MFSALGSSIFIILSNYFIYWYIIFYLGSLSFSRTNEF